MFGIGWWHLLCDLSTNRKWDEMQLCHSTTIWCSQLEICIHLLVQFECYVVTPRQKERFISSSVWLKTHLRFFQFLTPIQMKIPLNVWFVINHGVLLLSFSSKLLWIWSRFIRKLLKFPIFAHHFGLNEIKLCFLKKSMC